MGRATCEGAEATSSVCDGGWSSNTRPCSARCVAWCTCQITGSFSGPAVFRGDDDDQVDQLQAPTAFDGIQATSTEVPVLACYMELGGSICPDTGSDRNQAM
jgi:hypothetical protein